MLHVHGEFLKKNEISKSSLSRLNGRKWIPFGFASAFGELATSDARGEGLGRVSGSTADQSRDK